MIARQALAVAALALVACRDRGGARSREPGPEPATTSPTFPDADLRDEAVTFEPREREVERTLVGPDATDVRVSPDGKTVVVFDRASRPALWDGASLTPPLIAQKVMFTRSSFSPDGSALLLRWIDEADWVELGGLTVLRTRDLTVIHEERGAADARWIGPSTLAYRRGAQPRLLDAARGVATDAGPPLAGFGCPNSEGFQQSGIDTERSCPGGRFTRVLWADATSWIIADVRARGGGHYAVARLERVELATGARTTVLDLGFDPARLSLQPSVADDGALLCVMVGLRPEGPKGEWRYELACGPPAGPFERLATSDDSWSPPWPTHLPGKRVVVGTKDTLYDLAARTRHRVPAVGSVAATTGGTGLLSSSGGRDTRWIDLVGHTYTDLPGTGLEFFGEMGADPRGPRLFLAEYVDADLRYDLYDVRLR